MRKKLALIMTVVMALTLLAGCQGEDTTTAATTAGGDTTTTAATTAGTQATTQADTTADSNANKSLVVWYQKLFATAANDAFADRVEQFAQEKGVEVKLEMLDGTQLPILFNAGIEAGAKPDVTVTADYIVLHLFPDAPFLDLTDFIDEVEQTNGRSFTQRQKEAAYIDGMAYRMPFSSSAGSVYIRKDYLANAGITTLPATWDELFQMAAAATNASQGVYGLGVGCGPTDNDGEDFLRTLIWSYSGALFDAQGNPDPTNPKTVEALQLYVDCVKGGFSPPTVTTWDDSGNNSSYLSGESAIVWNANTLYNALKGEGNEDLLANTAVMGMPEGPGGRSGNIAPTGFSIFEDSPNIELAKEFLLYITEKDWYNSFFSSLAPVMCPVFEDTTDDPVWKDPVNQIVIEYNSNANSYGYPANTTLTGKKNGAAVKNQYLLNRAMQRCIIEDMPLEDSLAMLKNEMAEAIK